MAAIKTLFKVFFSYAPYIVYLIYLLFSIDKAWMKAWTKAWKKVLIFSKPVNVINIPVPPWFTPDYSVQDGQRCTYHMWYFSSSVVMCFLWIVQNHYCGCRWCLFFMIISTLCSQRQQDMHRSIKVSKITRLLPEFSFSPNPFIFIPFLFFFFFAKIHFIPKT